MQEKEREQAKLNEMFDRKSKAFEKQVEEANKQHRVTVFRSRCLNSFDSNVSSSLLEYTYPNVLKRAIMWCKFVSHHINFN